MIPSTPRITEIIHSACDGALNLMGVLLGPGSLVGTRIASLMVESV
jgi:hypothetical protein